MDHPTPDVSGQGLDPPPSPEAFNMASLDGASLPSLDCDGLAEAIDEVVFGDASIFFDEGSSLLPAVQPDEPSVENSPRRTAPIEHFAMLRPLSVDAVLPPSTANGLALQLLPTDFPIRPPPAAMNIPLHPTENLLRPPLTDLSQPDGSHPSVLHVRCHQPPVTVAVALIVICHSHQSHPLLSI